MLTRPTCQFDALRVTKAGFTGHSDAEYFERIAHIEPQKVLIARQAAHQCGSYQGERWRIRSTKSAAEKDLEVELEFYR